MNQSDRSSIHKESAAIGNQIYGQVVRLVLGYLTLAITTNALGSSLYGDYAFVLAVITTVSPLGSPGTRQVSLRMLDRGISITDAIGQPVKTEIIMTTLVLVSATVACWIVGGQELAGLAFIFGIGNLGSFGQVLETRLLQLGHYRYVVKNQNIQSVLTVIGSGIAWLTSPGIYVFAIAYVFGQLCRSGGLVSATLKEVNYWKCSFNWTILTKMLKDGLPYLAGGLGVSLLSRIDAFMVMGIQGASETGILSVASKVCESTFLIVVVTEKTLVASLLGKSGNQRVLATRKLFIGMFIAGLLASGAMAAFGNSTGFVFGRDFSQSGNVLYALSLSGIAISLNCALGSWMELNEHRRWLAARSVSALVFNVILNSLLIPRLGALGAGIGTTTSIFISALLPLALDRRLRLQLISSCRQRFRYPAS